MTIYQNHHVYFNLFIFFVRWRKNCMRQGWGYGNKNQINELLMVNKLNFYMKLVYPRSIDFSSAYVDKHYTMFISVILPLENSKTCHFAFRAYNLFVEAFVIVSPYLLTAFRFCTIFFPPNFQSSAKMPDPRSEVWRS